MSRLRVVGTNQNVRAEKNAEENCPQALVTYALNWWVLCLDPGPVPERPHDVCVSTPKAPKLWNLGRR